MQIVKLPVGEMAPPDTDCIKINLAADGGYALVASALSVGGDEGEAASVALVASDAYPSFDDAEAAGLAWAEAQGVQTIYVEMGDGLEPTLPNRGDRPSRGLPV